jgi:hypothetical protein
MPLFPSCQFYREIALAAFIKISSKSATSGIEIGGLVYRNHRKIILLIPVSPLMCPHAVGLSSPRDTGELKHPNEAAKQENIVNKSASASPLAEYCPSRLLHHCEHPAFCASLLAARSLRHGPPSTSSFSVYTTILLPCCLMEVVQTVRP